LLPRRLGIHEAPLHARGEARAAAAAQRRALQLLHDGARFAPLAQHPLPHLVAAARAIARERPGLVGPGLRQANIVQNRRHDPSVAVYEVPTRRRESAKNDRRRGEIILIPLPRSLISSLRLGAFASEILI